MASSGLIAIAAAIAIAVSTLGPAIAQGITAGKAMDAIARQPEAAGNIRSTLIVASCWYQKSDPAATIGSRRGDSP